MSPPSCLLVCSARHDRPPRPPTNNHTVKKVSGGRPPHCVQGLKYKHNNMPAALSFKKKVKKVNSLFNIQKPLKIIFIFIFRFHSPSLILYPASKGPLVCSLSPFCPPIQSLPALGPHQTQDDWRNVEKAGETSTSPSYNHPLSCSLPLCHHPAFIVNSIGNCLVFWFIPLGHRLSLSAGVCTMF